MASIKENRKNGKIISFKFRVFLGRDGDGKQQFKTKVWKPERNYSEERLWKQAEKEAAIWERIEIEAYQEKKDKFMPTEILFANFINNEWLPSISGEGSRATTIEFRGFIIKRVLPYFEGLRLADIDSKKAAEYLEYLKTAQANNGKPLSAQTRKHHYSTLNLIFAYAVKRGYIDNNPMDKVESPKLVKHKVDAFTKPEVSRFLCEIEKLPLPQKIMYYLLLTTGIRRGECFGLQWRDIDFESSLLQINRNVVYTAKELMKELNEKHPDFEYYSVLKDYYLSASTLLDFCIEPNGAFDHVKDTINSYKDDARKSINELEFVLSN